MNGRFNNHQFASDLDDSENSQENSGGDSPRSAVSTDTKIASTSSSKRSRRAIQKRVVSMPIRDVEGTKLKADHISAPPSDSWAWRKYGQKPIKGSPYPRGYYRCSSSKGCPARKQVERSRVDPHMLVVTYYCEHNHSWPANRSNHHKTISSASAAAAAVVKIPISEEEEEEEEEEEGQEEEEEEEAEGQDVRASKSMIISNQSDDVVAENKFTSLGEGNLIHNPTEFGWFSDFECTSCTMLESPMLTEDRITMDNEMAMIFTMREEDESLFADLGELPECSAVFRRGMAQREAEQRRPGLATTG